VALRLRGLAGLAIVNALLVAAAIALAQEEQKLSDAATAAKQLYQNVIFEDVIKPSRNRRPMMAFT